MRERERGYKVSRFVSSIGGFVRHIDAAKTTKDIGRYAPWDAIEFLKPILGTKKTIIISSNHAKRELSLSPLSREKSRNRARADERPFALGATKIFQELSVVVSLSLPFFYSLSLPYKIHTGESTREKKKRKTEIRKITAA